MLNIYTLTERALAKAGDDMLDGRLQDVLWIDMLHPTRDEEQRVEQALGIDVPTHEDMKEIEASSRLYRSGESLFMTTTVIVGSESLEPVSAPVTFVLHNGMLITVRYAEPRSFAYGLASLERVPPGEKLDGPGVFLALLEAIVDRLADTLERIAAGMDEVSRDIFATQRAARRTPPSAFQELLYRLGAHNDLASRASESLVTLVRLVAFVRARSMFTETDTKARLVTLRRDLSSLSEHVGFLLNKLSFLLDASLGMINIEQNTTIKIVSVAAVVFLPPTLIASIYGMNFRFMPELDWQVGYPLAIGLMVGSAVVSYLIFRTKNWL